MRETKTEKAITSKFVAPRPQWNPDLLLNAQNSQLTWVNAWIRAQLKVVPKWIHFTVIMCISSVAHMSFHYHKFTITEWNSRCAQAWESGIHKGRWIWRQKQLWALSQSWISALIRGLGAGAEQALFNGQISQYSGTTVEALSLRGCAVWISLSEEFLLERDSPPTAWERKRSLWIFGGGKW